MTLLIIFLDNKRNNFGVSGYVGRNSVAVILEFPPELLIIVNIAIQAGMDDAAVFHMVFNGLVINRMAVGLGDGTDRCPAGMG